MLVETHPLLLLLTTALTEIVPLAESTSDQVKSRVTPMEVDVAQSTRVVQRLVGQLEAVKNLAAEMKA